ncbi:MAG: CHAP domain-containing protein, partial [Oscillospiraceae bacterium]|nr:CHAP domain-containing protein [Oscillospiraceae bacterium]
MKKWFRNSLSILMSSVLLFSVFVAFPFSAFATEYEEVEIAANYKADEVGTGITQSQAVAWANSKIGQALDYDGAYGAQCVDFIFFYYRYLGVNVVAGNGKDFAWNSLPSGWIRTGTPSLGDIAVWTDG